MALRIRLLQQLDEEHNMAPQEIDSFHHFATDKLGLDEADDLSLDDIFDLWRIENP